MKVGERKIEERADWYGARVSNKKERRGAIKMTLDKARKRFLYTHAGKD